VELGNFAEIVGKKSGVGVEVWTGTIGEGGGGDSYWKKGGVGVKNKLSIGNNIRKKRYDRCAARLVGV